MTASTQPASQQGIETDPASGKTKPGQPTGDYYSTVYIPTRTALWWLYNSLGGVTTLGQENIPATGSAIIAPNHVSDADPPLVAITNPRRPVTIMAKESLFKHPVFGWYISQLGAFPVKRGQADRNALRMAIERLENERLLVLFPEGQRGDGINLQPAQRGLGLIALKTGAPVIPAYIFGTRKMLPKGGGLHRSKVGIIYAEPILPQNYKGKTAGDDLANDVMAKIAELKAAYETQNLVA